MTDFESHLTRQIAFSRGAFGPGQRTAGVIDHIRKELVEVESATTDDERAKEWVDVVILALDGLWRATQAVKDREYAELAWEPPYADEIACTVVGAIVDKQNRNERRDWPDWRTAPADKAIEHVRGNGDA